jgi:hypothetical protein
MQRLVVSLIPDGASITKHVISARDAQVYLTEATEVISAINWSHTPRTRSVRLRSPSRSIASDDFGRDRVQA